MIPDSLAHKVTAAIFPSLSWYVASIPQDETGYNKKVVVYNYKTDSWTTFDHGDNGDAYAPQYISDFFDENLEQVLYSTHYDGDVYQYADPDYGYDALEDSEQYIEAEWVSRADDFGAVGYRKFFRELWVNAPRVSGGQITLLAYYDEDTTASYSRSASLDIDDAGWKSYKFPTHDHPATLLRFGVKYEGTTQTAIDGLHVAVGVLLRRPTRAH